MAGSLLFIRHVGYTRRSLRLMRGSWNHDNHRFQRMRSIANETAGSLCARIYLNLLLYMLSGVLVCVFACACYHMISGGSVAAEARSSSSSAARSSSGLPQAC